MEIDIKRDLDNLFIRYEKSLKTEVVIGKPITIGKVILVPISKVILGCDIPKGRRVYNNKKDRVVAIGARISPNAIAVIKNGEVTMLPIRKKENLDKLLKMIPEIMSKVSNPNKDSKIDN